MKKSTIKSIIKWAVVVMITAMFFFGGFDGLKTKIGDLVTPPATETPAE